MLEVVLLPAARGAPQKAGAIFAGVVRVKVDMNAIDLAVAEVKDVAEAPAGRVPAGPGNTALGGAAAGALGHHVAVICNTVQRFDIVRNSTHPGEQSSGQFHEGCLAAGDSELWKVDLDVVGEQ